MALISLDEAKSYLRVDTEDEDAMIVILLSSAGRLCADVARLTDEQWAAVNDDNADAALAPVRETMRVAILYALGYLFEHREEADHHGIQKNETATDQYGNHKSVWQDYFTCWATAVTSGLSTKEEESAGHTVEADRLDLTVRWSTETAVVNSKQFRVLIGDRVYNILSIDEMGFRHSSRKFHTELSER